ARREPDPRLPAAPGERGRRRKMRAMCWGRFRRAAVVFAVLLCAAGATPGTEFPLRYTLSPGGPPFFTRGQSLLASDTPMVPVTLPPLHSRKPLFLTAQLGDGPDPTFTFVLDESTP